MRKTGLPAALLLLVVSTGCMTGPSFYERNDPTSQHYPGTDSWWNEKALLPPGVRQKCWRGKNWPVQPRSTEPPQQFSHTYHSEHYWPLPYVCADREYVRNILATQTTLGWQEETTVYNRHFVPETQQLTRPGQLLVERIAYEVPPDHRTIYVQSTHDAGLDTVRQEAVQNYLAQISAGAAGVPVVIREAGEYGRSARELQVISEQYNATFPAPRLGAAASAGATSDSGGGEGEGAN